MNKDTQFLQEAYTAIFEKKTEKWVPPWIKDKKEDKNEECKSCKKGEKCNCKKGKKCKDCENGKKCKKCSTKSKKDVSLEEAYANIVSESKHINKKFARRYNKVTGELLKADVGSKHYIKLKNERDELVKILADHGMTPSDLDEMLKKTEKDEVESMEPLMKKDEVSEDETETKNEVCSQCGDGHSKDECPENCY